MPGSSAPVRILVIDDSGFQCSAVRHLLEERFGERVEVVTFTDPRAALDHLDAEVDALLLDWEMPGLDGVAMLAEARRRGVDPKRIVVRSSHTADELHERFDDLGCLCVIEKGEREQQAAFLLVLDGLVRRAERRSEAT